MSAASPTKKLYADFNAREDIDDVLIWLDHPLNGNIISLVVGETVVLYGDDIEVEATICVGVTGKMIGRINRDTIS